MKRHRTFISEKYYSMLLAGSVTTFTSAAVIMVDALVGGARLGENAAAGISCVMPLYFIASFFSMAISIGVPILYSHAMGGFDQQRADRFFGTGLSAALLSGAVLFLLAVSGGEICLSLYCSDTRVYTYARDYLVWIRWAILLMPVNYLITGMVFADGGGGVSTAANIIEGAGKLVLSVLLCPVFGTAGLGLASVLSLLLSSLVAMTHFFSDRHSLRLNLFFSGHMLLEILRYSIVDACSYLFMGLFGVFLTIVVSVWLAPSMFILVSVILLIKEMQIAFDGIGEAVTPVITMYQGEQNHAGIRNIWRMAGSTAWIEGIVATVLLILLAPLIADIFGIQDPAVRNCAIRGIRLCALSLPFVCRMFLDTSYYILADRIPLGILVSALRDIIVSAVLILPGCIYGRADGLFLALAASPVIGYALSVLYVRIRYGKGVYPLFLEDSADKPDGYLFEFEVTPENIVHVQGELENALKEAGCSAKSSMRVTLLFEELFMMIYEKNPGMVVLAECFIKPGEKIYMTTKDNGVLFDPTDSDLEVSSLRSYVLSSIMSRYESRKTHILTLRFNRNAFDVTEVEL